MDMYVTHTYVATIPLLATFLRCTHNHSKGVCTYGGTQCTPSTAEAGVCLALAGYSCINMCKCMAQGLCAWWEVRDKGMVWYGMVWYGTVRQRDELLQYLGIREDTQGMVR